MRSEVVVVTQRKATLVFTNHHINKSSFLFSPQIKCNYIFVLDTGKVEENQTCLPKLLIFDLSDNELVRNVSIPEKVAFNASGVGLLVTPIVKDQYLKKDKNYRERFLNNVVVSMLFFLISHCTVQLE